MKNIWRKFLALIRDFLGRAMHRSHGSFIAGSAIAQFLPLISAPIVARLYTPTDFGTYAVFYALVTILGSSATLAFHNAVYLEKDDASAWDAVSLSAVTSFIFCLMVFGAMHVAPESILKSLFGEKLLLILDWLPLTIFLSSVYLVLYAWFVRNNRYMTLGRNKLILATATMLVQIGVGYLQLGAIGFVIANLIGYFLAIMLLVFSGAGRPLGSLTKISTTDLLGIALRHKRLPAYTLPAGLVNSFGSQIPELMINKLFGSHQLGQYSLANRMVSLPLSFLSTSLQDIFREQASREFNESGHCENTFRKFFGLLLIISAVLLVPIVLIVPMVFPVIFGNQWGEAGYLVRALVFLMAVRFISSPISYIWIIRGKQHIDLYWQIGLLLVSFFAFLMSVKIFQNPSLMQSLLTYSVFSGLWYVFCIFISKRFSRI